MTETPTVSRTGGTPTGEGSLAFADLARLGRPGWWRYFVSLPAILVGGAAAALLLVWLAEAEITPGVDWLLIKGRVAWRDADTVKMLTLFSVVMLAIGVFLPLTLAVVAAVHRRPWRSLITARTRFGWRSFSVSAGASVGISLLLLLADLLIDPPSHRVVLGPDRFFVLLPFILLLTPLQVAAEEVVFRGYLLQMVAHATRLWVLRLVIPAAIFAALHIANRENADGGVWGMLEFFILALYLGWLALRCRGLEEAIGFHLGINLVALSVVTTAVSDVLPPTFLFAPDPDVPFTGIACVLHWIVISRFATR